MDKLSRRSFMGGVAVGAALVILGLRPERVLKIRMSGCDVFCDTGSRVIKIGTYKLSSGKGSMYVNIRIDDDAAARIKKHLEVEGFSGTVRLT